MSLRVVVRRNAMRIMVKITLRPTPLLHILIEYSIAVARQMSGVTSASSLHEEQAALITNIIYD